MSFLRSLLSSKAKSQKKAVRGPEHKPTPERPLFVIGDLHGCTNLLEKMLEEIDKIIGFISLENPQIVFVGDYVDRGLDSRGVLTRLRGLIDEFPEHVTCLLGNHERMMLDFLDAPAARHTRWLRNGGAQTCASFGLAVDEHRMGDIVPEQLAADLRRSMGPATEEWLRGLPLRIQSGNVFVVHAAVDPARPIDDQSDRVLMWGHPEFMLRPRTDGIWVAHGHTIVDMPVAENTRISVDTGAYRTGILSAAALFPSGDHQFIRVKAG